MKVCVLILFAFIVLLCQCRLKNFVTLTNNIDPDIVLINIEEGDRAFIGNLLLKINACKPKLIGVDAWFMEDKKEYEDSVLMDALRKISNDFLSFALDENDKFQRSQEKFSRLVNGEGLAMAEKTDGLSSSFIPLTRINGIIYEQFSLKIIKQWKPDYKTTIEPGRSIPIKFTRTLDQYFNFNGSEIDDVDPNILNDKIVLVGYLGPRNADKHFTPIRFVKNYPPDEPDTYGVVIIANEIRTLLEYNQ